MELQKKHIEEERELGPAPDVALLCDIIDKEPSNYEEAVEIK